MKVKIKYIIDHGHNDERIVFDIMEDTDIGEFLVMDTTYTSDSMISNKVRHPYWFPDKTVKKGDLVVLYTKVGYNRSVANKNGNSSHFFYWGLNSNIWNNDGDAAVLMHINEWRHHRVSVK